MAAPPAYLDECADLSVAALLRQRGLSVTAASTERQTGLEDDEQLIHASSRDWVLVSHNAKDFIRWHSEFLKRHIAHGGIILVPETGPLSRLTLRTVMMLDWIGSQEHRSRLFRWGTLQTLLTQGYPLPGYTEAEVRHVLGHV